MTSVIDSSSLLSMVRYYLPFDKKSILLDYIEEKIASKEIIVLDKVYDECKYIAGGLVITKLPFLADKKHHLNTSGILPYRKFFTQLEDHFSIPIQRRKLSPAEYETAKDGFLESADAKMILYLLHSKRALSVDANIVTEESAASNDKKLFKKIPAICKILELQTLTLPELLNSYPDINFDIR